MLDVIVRTRFSSVQCVTVTPSSGGSGDCGFKSVRHGKRVITLPNRKVREQSQIPLLKKSHKSPLKKKFFVALPKIRTEK